MTGASQVESLKSCQTRVWGASGQTLAGPTNPKHAKLLLLNQPSVQNQIKIQLQFSKPGSARLGSIRLTWPISILIFSNIHLYPSPYLISCSHSFIIQLSSSYFLSSPKLFSLFSFFLDSSKNHTHIVYERTYLFIY
jgi:hypothetical protein